jgi:hypothetical protein
MTNTAALAATTDEIAACLTRLTAAITDGHWTSAVTMADLIERGARLAQSYALTAARADGATWTTLADALDLATPQAAQQRAARLRASEPV